LQLHNRLKKRLESSSGRLGSDLFRVDFFPGNWKPKVTVRFSTPC